MITIIMINLIARYTGVDGLSSSAMVVKQCRSENFKGETMGNIATVKRCNSATVQWCNSAMVKHCNDVSETVQQ